MNNKFIIVAGDPISVNSEIIYKTWKKLSKKIKKNIYLVGNFRLINSQYKKLNLKINLVKVVSIEDGQVYKGLKIIDVPLKFKNPFKLNSKNSSKYVLDCLNLAHSLAEKNKVKGIINCPINKKLLKRANQGVTEYLASKCKIHDNSEVMMIYNKKLSVVPVTTHISIKNISKKISSDLIKKKIEVLNKFFKKIFKYKPRIAILGLNPHNSEMSKSSEEKLKIIPAISSLKKRGFNIKGPFASDTIFIDNFKKFDVVVGMYHDQVLAPFKTLFNYDAINVTLGLNYLRVSPDHGTATNLIGKNKANYLSLFKCVKFIDNLKK